MSMKFGDYLREKREDKGWTQPDAAARAGIEQSYLSKLETGRSYPSEDVFARLVETYSIDTDDMTRRVESAELQRLKDIGAVRGAIMVRERNRTRFARGWLVAGLVCLMLGGAGIGLNTIDMVRVEPVFRYQSMGVLGPEWPLEAYDLVDVTLPEDMPNYQELFQRQQMLIGRLDMAYRDLDEYRGDWFVEPVDEGRRYFQLYDNSQVRTVSPLRWLVVPAFMFLIAGPACFFISYRWG